MRFLGPRHTFPTPLEDGSRQIHSSPGQVFADDGQGYSKVVVSLLASPSGTGNFFVVVRADAVRTHHNKNLFGAAGPDSPSLRTFEWPWMTGG